MKRPTQKTVVPATLLGLAGTLWLWKLSDDPVPVLVSVRDLRVLFGALVLVAVLVGWSVFRLVERSAGAVVAGMVVLVSLILVGGWARRYTDMGVFVLGGDRYWIGRAVDAPSADLRSRYVQLVLESTDYGVNSAENAVMRLPLRDQVEMFSVLAEVVKSESWRERYLRRAEEAKEQL